MSVKILGSQKVSISCPTRTLHLCLTSDDLTAILNKIRETLTDYANFKYRRYGEIFLSFLFDKLFP